jgi:hypothetical protein
VLGGTAVAICMSGTFSSPFATVLVFTFFLLLFTYSMGWKTPAKHGPALHYSPAIVQQCRLPLYSFYFLESTVIQSPFG